MVQQLTPNFSLDEMLRSQTASRFGFDEQYSPPRMVVGSLIMLCVNLLQPIRDLYGKAIFVSSGYRCERVNAAVGGQPNSQHLKGEAADLDCGSREANKALFELIVVWQKQGLIEFDQLINEYGYEWIHISYRRTGKQRNQVLNIK